MASVQLFPRKEFIITLDSGEQIKGKFGTWAMKMLHMRKNLTNDQVKDFFNTKIFEAFPDYLLYAVESIFRELKNKESFPYNDIDACNWIDELGGLESEGILNLVNHSTSVEKKSDQESS